MFIGEKEFKSYQPLYDAVNDEVVKTRIQESMKYYIRKATIYKVAWQTFSVMGILLPATATAVVAFGEHGEILAVLTAITTMVAGFAALFKCREKKNHYRSAAERIKKELCLYHCRAEHYGHASKFRGMDEKQIKEKQWKMFVSRIEFLIADEMDKADAIEKEDSTKQMDQMEKEIKNLKAFLAEKEPAKTK